MTNSVFERALTAHRETFAAVEAEIQRLAGVQQHLDALNTQRRELQATVSQLAQQIPAHQRAIDDAKAAAAAAIETEKAEKARIVAEARETAASIVAQGRSDASALLDKAKSDAASYEARVAEAEEKLSSILDQIKVQAATVAAARNRLLKMQEHAGAFAAVELD
jgi:chromosome segregation ATPase